MQGAEEPPWAEPRHRGAETPREALVAMKSPAALRSKQRCFAAAEHLASCSRSSKGAPGMIRPCTQAPRGTNELWPKQKQTKHTSTGEPSRAGQQAIQTNTARAGKGLVCKMCWDLLLIAVACMQPFIRSTAITFSGKRYYDGFFKQPWDL